VKPRQFVARAQRILIGFAFLGALYLVWRVDTLRLPAAGCSPVLRFEPGAFLLLDARPPRLQGGDVVLFGSEGGSTLYLGVIEREQDGRFWILTNNPECPGTGSEKLGWIARDAIRGRALLALPW